MNPARLRFRAFELDLERYELRRAGRALRLQRLPMELLILLAQRPGVLVTRGEIAAKLWPNDPAEQHEQDINTAIRKIRQALGDEADRSRFVETVIGKGYRFTSLVEQCVEEALPSPALRGPVSPPADRPSINAIVRAGALLCLAALLGSAFWHFGEPSRTLTVAPLTALPGDETEPDLSADGDKVVFAWAPPETLSSKIYVRAGQMPSPKVLTAGAGRDFSPVWSPDDRQVAFLREDKGHFSVLVISAAGGQEKLVADLAYAGADRLAFSPDGKNLAVRDSENREAVPGLFLISVETGLRKRLTTSDRPGGGDSAPAFSPDGQKLAFHRNTGVSGAALLYVAPVSADGSLRGQPVRITRRALTIHKHCAWTSDSDGLLCAAGSGLVRVPRSTGDIVPLPFEDAIEPAVARHGGRMAFVRSLQDTDIFRVDSATGQSRPIAFSTRNDRQPHLAPDGRRIAFVSSRSGAPVLWVADSDGNNAAPLVDLGGDRLGVPRWSPDGDHIAFDALRDGSSHIFVVSSEGGAPKRVTQAGGPYVRPAWSPDGQWIYFASAQSGNWEIWKTTFDAWKPVQVTHEGGRECWPSSDGRFLFFTKAPPAQGIWRVSLDGGKPELVNPEGNQGRWSVSKNDIYYQTPLGELARQDLITGARAVMPTPGLRQLRYATVSSDSRWFLIQAASSSGSDLIVVNNFH